MQPEAKFKSKLKECFEEFYAAEPHYWIAIVASMMQKAGIPDLFCAAEGRCAWIEAKVDGNWLRSSQTLMIPQMVAAGTRVIVLSADMETDKTSRTVKLSEHHEGVFVRGRIIFRWNDMSTHMFWRTVLGIYGT